MHSLTARFLRDGDRFEWNGEIFTADDDAIAHDGVVTVPLGLADGSSDWVELPAEAQVPLRNDDDIVTEARAAEATFDDVEVVVLDPRELMLADEALRNYDITDAAVAAYRAHRDAGMDAGAARRAVAERQLGTDRAMVDTALALFEQHVATGGDAETARSAAVIDAADQFTARVTEEQAAAIAAAFATTEPHVGEVDVNDAPWAFSPPAPAPLPERPAPPGSWIARNLTDPADARDHTGPDGAAANPTPQRDDIDEEPDEMDLATALEMVAADTRDGVGEPEMSDAAAIAMTVADLTHADVQGAVDDQALREAYFQVLDATPGEITTHLGDNDGLIAAASARAVPEREPEPDSWIARNLPGGTPSAADANEDVNDVPWTNAGGFEIGDRFAQPTARMWDAVNSLPAGVVTDADLDRAGITRDEFNRVTREAAERVDAEEWAQLQAERRQARRVEAAGDREPAAGQHEDVGRRTADVLADIDAMLAEPEPPPLRAEVAQCGRAVAEAERAVQCTGSVHEDDERAERCAQWSTDEQATADAAGADDVRGLE
jgi:hypothetical protein